MSGWNLPPGVTGNEAVFGPQDEVDVELDKECADCGFSGWVTVTRLGWTASVTECWDCPTCGQEHEDEGVIEDEVD